MKATRGATALGGTGALIGLIIFGALSGAAHAQYPAYPYNDRYWLDRGYAAPCGMQPCSDPRVIRREVQRELQREEAARAQEQQVSPPPRTPPPATRVEEIRPQYEGASQIRDEFRRSGEPR